MSLTKLTTADLKKELARREKGVTKLEKRRDKIAKELAAVEKDLAALGGRKPRGGGRPAASTGRRTRAKNDISLPDAVAAAMEVGAVVSPKEAAALVLSNGYKTTSKTFGVQVSQALTKDKRFKRVGRGQYERVK